MKKTIIYLLLFCILPVYSQSYQIKYLGVEQGISNNYILGITQDKYGFMWFATEEGLNKFDGNSVIPYYKYSSENLRLTGNELNSVYADKEEPIIWIATQRAGLNAYNYEDNTFSVYMNNETDPYSLATNDVTDIEQATDGNIWVSTYHRGVDLFDKKEGIFIHYNQSTLPELVSNSVWTILDGKDGNLYIGHVNHGFTILSLKDRKLLNFMNDPDDLNSLPGNEVRCIYKDRQNSLWIGTNNGLALYNPDTHDFFVFRHEPGNPHSLPSNTVHAIKQYDDTKLIIATELNGISFLDIRRPLFMSLQNVQFQNSVSMNYAQQIAQSTVRCIFRDTFDNLWFGTYGDGIHFMAKETSVFHNWSYIPDGRTGLNHKVAWGICTDTAGRIWVGTDGGGINLFQNGERIAIYNRENGKIDNNSVLTAYTDSQGKVWVGTFQGGIHYYDPVKDRFLPLPYSVEDALDVRCFYEDSRKNMWVGTNKGIYVFPLNNPGKVTLYNSENTSLPEDFIRSIQMDDRQRIWVGTFGRGVTVFTPDMQLVRIFDEDRGFLSNTVNQIYKDTLGRIWVATGDGLIYFPEITEELSFRIFARNDGMTNSFIRAITEDKEHNIWFSSNNGISCYRPDEELFYNYTHQSSEIPIGNFMSGSVTEDREGNIYFGSINGVCYYDPSGVVEEKVLPPVVITGLTVYEKLPAQQETDIALPIKEDKKILLKHDQNTFTINFSIQNYALANQVKYAYMLKGSQDSWFSIEGENSVTFRSLRPGSYDFLVKAKVDNQDWDEAFTTCHLQILPPWWMSWWAIVLYTCLAILACIFILRFYNHRLYMENMYELEKQQLQKEKELNDERLRFYTNITHELRTPLSLILGPLEDLVHEYTLPQESLRKVSIIHQSAIQLLKLINQLLEFRKTETQNKRLCVSKDDITAVVREIGLRYKELNSNRNIRVELDIPTDPLFIFYDREMILTILNNLLSNALKYTEQGIVVLSLRIVTEQDLEYTEIEVKDTGRGIAPDALPHIFDRYYQAERVNQVSGTGIGLALVRNLVDLHQATIHVDSKVNEGSSFTLRLLNQNTYPDALHADPDVHEEEVEIIDESTDVLFTHKPVVLVVEDNRDISDYIAESFKEKYEVYTAVNGKEGLELAFSKIPDIVVSDIMMPEMNGLELCKILKEDMRTSHIPVVLLTAKDTLSDRTEGYESGADSYLTKPFSASLLRSRVANLLDARKKLANLVSSNQRTQPETDEISRALSKLDNAFLEKIVGIIEENLSTEKIDVGFIADRMCMSHSTLYRKIKSLTNVSTNEFVRKIRLRKAAQLLLEGEYHISEITYRVGFNSPKYFRQCFKEEFGVSPSEYRPPTL